MASTSTPSTPSPGVVRESTLVCPRCNHGERMMMAENSSLVVHVCQSCGLEMHRLPGNCCLFCTWGTVPCPTAQRAYNPGLPPTVRPGLH